MTPSSKVVGDLALHPVGTGVSVDEFAADPGRFDIPDSVVGFLRSVLGDPAGGRPELFRTKSLTVRNAATFEIELSDDDERLLDGTSAERRTTLSRLLFPGPAVNSK